MPTNRQVIAALLGSILVIHSLISVREAQEIAGHGLTWAITPWYAAVEMGLALVLAIGFVVPWRLKPAVQKHEV